MSDVDKSIANPLYRVRFEMAGSTGSCYKGDSFRDAVKAGDKIYKHYLEHCKVFLYKRKPDVGEMDAMGDPLTYIERCYQYLVVPEDYEVRKATSDEEPENLEYFESYNEARSCHYMRNLAESVNV